MSDRPSLATDPHAWYSTSIVEAAVVGFFLLLRETAPPYIIAAHPVVLRRVSWHAAVCIATEPKRPLTSPESYPSPHCAPYIPYTVQHGLKMRLGRCRVVGCQCSYGQCNVRTCTSCQMQQATNALLKMQLDCHFVPVPHYEAPRTPQATLELPCAPPSVQTTLPEPALRPLG
jgi:hypothetical protein